MHPACVYVNGDVKKGDKMEQPRSAFHRARAKWYTKHKGEHDVRTAVGDGKWYANCLCAAHARSHGTLVEADSDRIRQVSETEELIEITGESRAVCEKALKARGSLPAALAALDTSSGRGMGGAASPRQVRAATARPQEFRPRWLWTGPLEIDDMFAVGNSFSAVDLEASSDVFWSIGTLRSFHLYHLSPSWMAERNAVYPLSFFLKRVQEASPTQAVPVHERMIKRLTDCPCTDNPLSVKLQTDDDVDHTYTFLSNGTVMRDDQDQPIMDGVYRIVAVETAVLVNDPFRPKKKSLVSVLMSHNAWYEDVSNQFTSNAWIASSGPTLTSSLCEQFSPGFRYTDKVVDRLDRKFMTFKSSRTADLNSALIKAWQRVPTPNTI